MAFINSRLDSYHITCADLQGLLSDIVQQGVVVTDVKMKGDITVNFCASTKYRRRLKKVADSHDASVDAVFGFDIQSLISNLKRRSLLFAGLATILILTALLPQRILFVSVTGNQKLPDALILEKAAQCGIGFWSSRKEVRSERVKNTLLEVIPELQWAGVNTSGCVATISVTERSNTQQNAKDKEICSIVAARDGIIKKCTVINGNPLCKPGQAIKAGQTLVSGYIDTGLLIRAVKAEAEIVALTNRELQIVSMPSFVSRGEIIRAEKRYSIIIGKKLINLFKDSGILDSTCVKINEVYPLTLPGGFVLPITLIRQDVFEYEPITDTSAVDGDHGWLSAYAQSYLKRNMVAGKIIQADDDIFVSDGAAYLSGTYFCEEIIGKSLKEVNLNDHAKDS